jgi:hypothetical protein
VGGSSTGNDGGFGLGLCDISSCPAGCCDGDQLGIPATCVDAAKICTLDTLAASLSGNFNVYKCNGTSHACE